jgi:hypothetical protein
VPFRVDMRKIIKSGKHRCLIAGFQVLFFGELRLKIDLDDIAPGALNNIRMQARVFHHLIGNRISD